MSKIRSILFLFLILILTAASLLAAAPAAKKDSSAVRRVLSYAQFVKEMVECQEPTYELVNADLVYDELTDSAFVNFVLDGRTRDFTYGEQKTFLPTYTIKPDILLQNVRISAGFAFYNFHFLASITLRDSIVGALEFDDCIFNDGETNAFVCRSAKDLSSLRFYRCKLQSIVVTVSQIERLMIFNSSIQEQSFIRSNRMEDLFVENVHSADLLSLAENILTNTEILQSTFSTFSFSSSVQRALTIAHCTIDSAADFYAVQFPHKNTAIAFSQLAGKLGIDNDTIFYRARTEAELADESDYNDFISVYTDFLSLYKTRGDQESYNACYVEMKQVQTRRAGYLYHKKPKLETWFDWRLNQLLDVFSDYGTNSAKGLIYIFYVVFGFAALYLIFPSEKDNLSREKAFRMFDVVIGYFSTNSSLVNISVHKRQRALDDLHNFRTTLKVSREDVPGFIHILGTPLYALNKSYVRTSEWFVRRFDIIPGRWNELSKGRKIWTGMAIGAYMLGFLAWGLVMRIVNAVALSVNAFVTLGYGEIQARGVARYLAVLEGAIGWFLLSIFSVTLISQLLQ